MELLLFREDGTSPSLDDLFRLAEANPDMAPDRITFCERPEALDQGE